MSKIVTELEIAAAVKTLAGSDRGRAALQAQLAWLDDSGISLDRHGQRAVQVLLIATWTDFPMLARDAMREALEEPVHAAGAGK